MKKLVHIALGLTLACFVGTTASAQTGTKTKKDQLQPVEMKKAEEVKVKTETPATEGVETPTDPVKSKTKVRTRAISIDEEGVDDGDSRTNRSTTTEGTSGTATIKKAKSIPKLED